MNESPSRSPDPPEPTTDASPTTASTGTGPSSKRRQWKQALRRWFGDGNLLDRMRHYFRRPVTVGTAFPLLLVISILVYTRSFWTNYIFDEQEALLANPYVNGNELGFWDVFRRDFWGLPATGTIGSYRPLPNIIWRILWKVRHHAWLPHWFNVVLHGANAAMVAHLAQQWLGSRRTAWLSGLAFVLAAVITEAVCGVVGIADVLSGTFILLTLCTIRIAWYWQFPLTTAFLFLGLLSKESTLTATPMVAVAALVIAPLVRPERPQRGLKFLSMGLGAVAALVLYTYFRREFFEVKLPARYANPLGTAEPFARQLLHDFLRWFQQPDLPKDPINNPLVDADTPHRIAGALRVYFRGLVQVVFPWSLSGDYSYPQEPVPDRLLFPGSILGGLLMVVPPMLSVVCMGRGLWLEFTERWRARKGPNGPVPEGFALSPRVRVLGVVALALLWIPLTYFPHSNIPILLPTVRAERFWYIPVIASSLLVGLLFSYFWNVRYRRYRDWTLGVAVAFFGFQALQARVHGLDYRNDLFFWRSTARSVPNSAKAHLNYGVMLGARRNLEGRLRENAKAVELAPKWPMAHIYHGDTLCRLHRVDEAWPHYVRGFELGPNHQSLIALAIQCLWDEKAFDARKDELKALADKHKGSWLAHIVNDTIEHGEENRGVDPQYRPRGYDQGPRKSKKDKKNQKEKKDENKKKAPASSARNAASSTSSSAAERSSSAASSTPVNSAVPSGPSSLQGATSATAKPEVSALPTEQP